MVVRCSRRMLDLLGGRALRLTELPPADDDWYLNLLWLGRRKCLLLTHAETLFSVFRAGVRAADLRPLGPYVVRAVEAELHSESLPPATFAQRDADAVRLAKTASRSTLGFMNEMAVHLRDQIADAGGLSHCDINTLNHHLRRTLHNRGGYVYPIELVTQRLRCARPIQQRSPTHPRTQAATRVCEPYGVAAMLAPLGLQLRPAKTRVVCLTRGAEGFDFLGFHQHKVESWRWRGRWYLQRWPSSRALMSVRAKIRSLTDRRLVGWPIEAIVAKLNRSLRGWAAYFRHGNSARKFDAIDRYVHERLAIWASAKHGRHGRNWQHRYTAAWLARLGVYRLSGKVRYETAHASR